MRITQDFFNGNKSEFTGPTRTSTYVIIEELLRRRYKVEMPYWPARTIRFSGPNNEIRTINGVVNRNTPELARLMSNNKFVGYRLAEELGLPIPYTEVYETPQQAMRFWDKHWGKCVLKAVRGTEGKYVWMFFSDKEEFVSKARNESIQSTLLLQAKSAAMIDVRLLFIGGEVVATTVRRPCFLLGDGVSSISEILDAENDKREHTNVRHHSTMTLAKFDVKKTLKKIQRKAEDVLNQGERLQISLANISNGGIAEDATDIIHADFVSLAAKMDKALMCPVLAIDFLCDDPAASLEDNPNKVIFLETNVRPGIDLHQYPHIGKGRNVASVYIDYVLEKCHR